MTPLLLLPGMMCDERLFSHLVAADGNRRESLCADLSQHDDWSELAASVLDHAPAIFDVVGVSLDDNADSLKKFVTDNGMNWPQYFDGKGWENEIAQRFGIRTIPATFLIGKGGKVVASNLRGSALEEAIEAELGGE